MTDLRFSALVASVAHDAHVAGLSVYVVGGAVRDALLGRAAGDRDWVVVGATPEELAARGFTPVGGDFPVFLHPVSHEEYALARTERKSGRGYKGFTFYTGTDVSLEDDLRRRDLTVNAIALASDGRLVDPLNGQGDIRKRVLRHVGDAFAEDPVRLLRLARFAARFPDFSIAPETMALARRLVDEGEVDALVPERIWQEIAKGLQTAEPARFFQVLADTGALTRVLPGFTFCPDSLQRELSCAAQRGLSVAGRFALACRVSASPDSVARHVKAPGECIDHARLLAIFLNHLLSGNDTAADNLALMQEGDAFRKPERFVAVLQAAGCVCPVNLGLWQSRLNAVRAIDAGSIARLHPGNAAAIQAALKQARLDALAAL
ncbi:MAG: tRNA CCA-pyrophosphorylase [Burkholderiaceae bacterium]